MYGLIAVTSIGICSGIFAAQQKIPTGGPLPDVRGFNNKINDVRETSKISWVIRHVAGQVYVAAGAGGHVVIFAGNDGILLVDTNFTVFYDQIMAAIRQVSNAPIRFVVNTHSHLDHAQNNDKFAAQGAVIIDPPNTRRALATTPDARGLPVITSSAPLTLYFNGEEVSYVPLKPAHTDGDVAVYFHGSDVWAFGDEYTGDYPGMSVQQGGTTQNYIDNYNLALQMTKPGTIFVPGHGQMSDRARVIALRDVITTVHTRVRDMVAKGMTLAEISKARPSREFDPDFAAENHSPTTFVTTESWYKAMYDEISAEKKAGRN
jgi:glyoxylase-like metal-dependent hydrolase (beta-lactamase superfamily II)